VRNGGKKEDRQIKLSIMENFQPVFYFSFYLNERGVKEGRGKKGEGVKGKTLKVWFNPKKKKKTHTFF